MEEKPSIETTKNTFKIVLPNNTLSEQGHTPFFTEGKLSVMIKDREIKKEKEADVQQNRGCCQL